jgi:hypothetical protein
MMRPLLVLPLLLAGCVSAWPPGSYVEVSPADANVLAPAIADYLTSTLPGHQDINLITTGPTDPIAPLVVASLDANGFTNTPTGRKISYVAAPTDGGVLLRINIDDQEGASRFYSYVSGVLLTNGPLMVATP